MGTATSRGFVGRGERWPRLAIAALIFGGLASGLLGCAPRPADDEPRPDAVPILGSCDVREASHFCEEHYADQADMIEDHRELCEGTWSEGPCPVEGQRTRCRTTGIVGTQIFYGYGEGDVEDWRESCERAASPGQSASFAVVR